MLCITRDSVFFFLDFYPFYTNNPIISIVITVAFLQAIFQRYPRPEKEYQSFSLLYNDRSLDLVSTFTSQHD